MSPTQKDLSERAMLVRVTVSYWRASKIDQVVGEETADRKHADSDSVKSTTRLVPKEALTQVTTARSQLMAVHERFTLPWLDGGIRILPAVLFDQYTGKVRQAKAAFDDAVAAFIQDYPRYVESAPQRLGDLLDTTPMPAIAEIIGKFGVKQEVLPMPSSNDFRVAMGADQAAQVKKRIEQSIADMTAKAVGSLYKQLAEVVEKIAKTLAKEDKVFRDSLIGNLKDLCDAIPALNINDDPQLEALRKECSNKLANLKPDVLREEKDARQRAAEKAKSILESIRKIDLDIE